jgi:type I restriction enzyme S subunit
VREWRAVRLKHVASVRVSNVDKKSADDQLPVKLCNYTDVYYNENITSTIPFMAATASPEQIREFQLQRGDVLITKDSETPDDIAVPAHVVGPLDGVVCGYHLAVLRPRRRQVHGRYLFWSLKSTPLREQFAAGATGVTRFGLRTDVIGDACLLLPEPSRQRVIADFLDAETARIDALIAKKRQLVDVLQWRRLAATAAGVSGRLTRSQDDLAESPLPWLDLQPADWRTVKLTLVARLGSGHTPSRDHAEWWEDCTVPWITTGEVARLREDRIEYVTETREKISEQGIANSSATIHPAGTVVLSRTASAGFSAIMGTDMATSQDFATWTCGPLLEPRFLLLCLRAMRQDLLPEFRSW